MKAPKELLAVARRLGDLQESTAFVGGMVRSLLITDEAVAGARNTKDVDLVVEVEGLTGYYAFAARLRKRGFIEGGEQGSPICRWSVDGIPVDIMPTDPSVLGFSNVWYPEALKHAPMLVVDGVQLRTVDAAHFCATKLEAWLSRGDDELWHHDLEDVVAMVDGCPGLLAELRRASKTVQGFVGRVVANLVARVDFRDALPGHLAPDDASQARLPLVLGRLRAIAELSDLEQFDDDETNLLDSDLVPPSGPGHVIIPLTAESALPWITVRSSNLRAVRYDSGSLELSIQFRSGHVYTYFGVGQNVFDALIGAGSKGSFHARWIRNRYRYRRVR